MYPNLLHLLLTAVLVLPMFSLAQERTCTYSCPETDLLSWSLITRPYTIGFDSHYSIFECVYSIPNPTSERSEHKCSYNKISGAHILGSVGDNCPLVAVPCPQPSTSGVLAEGELPPLFSNEEKDEVMPWVVNGRYLLYLKHHFEKRRALD